jgi:hypothetical protein
MPTYRITGPDGKTYEVTAPDGASEQDVLAYVQSQAGTPKPKQPAKPQTFDPSAGGGTLSIGPFDTGIQTPEWLDRGLAGMGKAFADLGRGAGQAVGAVSRADVAESRKRDAALMNTTAGKVGNFAGNVAAIAPTALIPGANTVAGAGAIGAATGFLQPSTSTQETLMNVGLGGAAGAGGQKVANMIGARLAQPVAPALTQGQQAAKAAGEKLGMRLTPGKATGSRALQKVEAAFESNPITGRGFDVLRDNNQAVLNRAAAKSIGETADEVSTPVLDNALSRMESVFDSVADRTPVALDPITDGAKIAGIRQQAAGMLNNNADLADNALFQMLDNVVNAQGGATREQLRAMSSNLGRAARNNMTTPNGDRELGQALFQLQEVVEDAVQGSLNPAQQAAYAEARGQYRNLLNLTGRTNVINPGSGDVNGRTLANNLSRRDRQGFVFGRNNAQGAEADLYDAARFTQAFPELIGNSGTATRSLGPADWLASLPGSVLSRLYLSDPSVRALVAAQGGMNAIGRLSQQGAQFGAMPQISVPAALAVGSNFSQQ